MSLVPDTWWCQAKINRCLGFLESLEEWGIGVQRGRHRRETYGAFLLKRHTGSEKALEIGKCRSPEDPEWLSPGSQGPRRYLHKEGGGRDLVLLVTSFQELDEQVEDVTQLLAGVVHHGPREGRPSGSQSHKACCRRSNRNTTNPGQSVSPQLP